MDYSCAHSLPFRFKISAEIFTLHQASCSYGLVTSCRRPTENPLNPLTSLRLVLVLINPQISDYKKEVIRPLFFMNYNAFFDTSCKRLQSCSKMQPKKGMQPYHKTMQPIHIMRKIRLISETIIQKSMCLININRRVKVAYNFLQCLTQILCNAS